MLILNQFLMRILQFLEVLLVGLRVFFQKNKFFVIYLSTNSSHRLRSSQTVRFVCAKFIDY